MKNYLLIILLTLLTIFSGCSTHKFKSFKSYSNKIRDIKLPNFRVPFLEKLKVDESLTPPYVKPISSTLSEVSIGWSYNPKDNISGFRIFRYSPKSKEFILIATIRDKYVTSYVDKNLKQATNYIYAVSTFTSDKRVSRISKPVSVYTKGFVIKPELFASKDLIRKIKLTWNLNTNKEHIKYYQILRSKDQTNFRNYDTVYKSLQSEYIDDRLKDGDGYYYKIYAVTYDGAKSEESNIAYGYTKTAPRPPADIIATTNLPRKIQLKWFDPNDNDKTRRIVRYNIYTSLYKDKFFIKHASTRGNEKYFIDLVNQDGKRVYYKVTAIDTDGLESPLPPTSAMGATKASSPAPKIIQYNIVDGRVIIKWEPMSRNIKSYIVKKRFYSKFFLPKTINYKGITTNQFIDRDIKLKKTYKYQVIGVDNDGILTKPSKEISVEIR